VPDADARTRAGIQIQNVKEHGRSVAVLPSACYNSNARQHSALSLCWDFTRSHSQGLTRNTCTPVLHGWALFPTRLSCSLLVSWKL
jgi:hypothetical protein